MSIISMLTIKTVAIVVSISYSTKSMTFFYWTLYFQILATTLVLVTIVYVISVKIIWSFWNEMNLCWNLFAIFLYLKIYFQSIYRYWSLTVLYLFGFYMLSLTKVSKLVGTLELYISEYMIGWCFIPTFSSFQL
jgi:hypothetical protein